MFWTPKEEIDQGIEDPAPWELPAKVGETKDERKAGQADDDA